jgi:hypothetical protein
MNKQLQFELWEQCNSLCKFCYLGTENRFTPDHLKIQACEKALEKISDLSLYPEYDTLSYLGGEFFQGQMSNPEVKKAFMNLMKKTAGLLKEGIVSHVWIYATLTIGDQKDLYETLDLFEGHKGELWVLTSYDTLGRFHTPKMEENWSYHMKNIHKLYPEILFNITTILSEDCIDKYLSGELSFKKMMEEYHTSFFFKQCGASNITLQEMNKRLPGFVPPRKKFLQFLKKFRAEESPMMWDKLFNIKYRADTLYRNGNSEDTSMQLNTRHKDSNAEVELDHISSETELAECGHLKNYHAYSDCDGCVICDKQMIEKMMS